ncbi:MAG TPA: hypothetical protein VHX66_15100 [Solirubrobacteraceae bacterium]|jgi:hypothetical protein|nr:hypothetical protein [Solirubrobacteraceae bacterium]
MSVTTDPPVHDSLDPEAGVIEEGRARQRRHRSAGGVAVLAAAIATTLLVSGGLGGGGAPQPTQPTAGPPASHGQRTALTACVQRGARGKALQGTPSKSLLAILGVLRRPATPADALPAAIERSFLSERIGGGIFVKYIRRARVIGPIGVWVYPMTIRPCNGAAEAGMAEYRAPLVFPAGGEGGGVGTAAQIAGGRGFGSSSTFGLSRVTMLVPDGVASVVLHYPAGKIGGFDRHRGRAVTLAATVVGNVMVVAIPRNGMRLLAPMTMTWRAASGAVVKTFNSL